MPLSVFIEEETLESPIAISFTVELKRCKVPNVSQWHLGLYDGSLSYRLGQLLDQVYNLRLYGNGDYWWLGDTKESLQVSLEDVCLRLERYGIAFLEDLNSRQVSAADIDPEFGEILQDVLAPRLATYGYKAQIFTTNWNLSNRKPLPHFVKKLDNQNFAFINIKPASNPTSTNLTPASENPTSGDRNYFCVWLACKPSSNPHTEMNLSETRSFQGWFGPDTYSSNDIKPALYPNVLWDYYEKQDILFSYNANTKQVISKHRDNIAESLTSQFQHVLLNIEQHALLIIERES
jgi:hypothetical protein